MEIAVASTKDLSPGAMMGIEKEGKSILVANVNGAYYGIGNRCTHVGCLLSAGTLEGERVQCRCHGSTFDVRTGKVLKGPAENAEPSFKLRVAGDQILADI